MQHLMLVARRGVSGCLIDAALIAAHWQHVGSLGMQDLLGGLQYMRLASAGPHLAAIRLLLFPAHVLEWTPVHCPTQAYVWASGQQAAS